MPHSSRFAGLFLGALLVAPASALAARVDTIVKLVEDGKHEDARKKCERWEAWLPGEEPGLRVACARAFWPVANRTDTVAAWAAYRQRWKDTPHGRQAREREAESGLRELPTRVSEDELLAFARKYDETTAADEALAAARDAAVRDAQSPDEATAVAIRYPGHAGLPKLVARYPEGFVKVAVEGHEVTVTLDPHVDLPPEYSPRVRWVARDDNRVHGDWAEVAKSELMAAGLPLAAIPKPSRDGPGLPVCVVPGKSDNFRASVSVEVGDGTVFSDVPWDAGCGFDSWPSFLAVSGGRVASLSLGPGHRVDLGHMTDEQRVDRATQLAGLSGGAGLLDDQRIFERGTRAWLVHAVSGGAPWLSALGPGEGAVPLDASFRGPAMPRGWRAASEGDAGQRIYSSSVGADQPPWRIGHGEIRVVPPLSQAVLGLGLRQATPKGPKTTALTASAGFSQSPNGLVEPRPPRGGSVAGLYSVDVGDIQALTDQIAAVGVTDVEILDAWRCDLDQDKVPETLVRARRQGEGMAFILDPYKKNAPRIFPFRTPRVRLGDATAPTPFAFRVNDRTYLAWGHVQQTESTAWSSTLTALRADGDSYALDTIVLPGSTPLPTSLP